MASLLAALPRADYDRLQPQLQRVRLDAQQVLHWPGEPITRVYFPISSVLSVLVSVDEGVEVEAGLVGSEGVLGLPIFLGATVASHRAVVQVAGDAWRLSAAVFRDALSQSAALRHALGRYAQAFFVQVAQAVGCNRIHTMDQRCARWLLMVHDRVGEDRFALTQERLAEKLGVRRATVGRAMADFQRGGVLRYTRGVVTILNRRALTAASCVCYDVIEGEATRLLGTAPDSPSPD